MKPVRSFNGACGIFFCCLLITGDVQSVAFTSGNIVVQSQTPGLLDFRITEFSLEGDELQSLSVPQPPEQTEYLHPRDLAFDKYGYLHLYNGTFDPYLSSYHLSSESWSHITTPGWSTVNNVSYGGLATFSNLVFVTDMITIGEKRDEVSGIIAFNTTNGSAKRFAKTTNPIDLNVGLNGMLYALSGSTVSIYDTQSFRLIDSVSLNPVGDYCTISVDAAGNIYAATGDGYLRKFDSSGTHQDSIETTDSAIDLDVNIDGIVALGTRNGVFITDTEFSTLTSIENGRLVYFVTFTPIPDKSITIDINPIPSNKPNNVINLQNDKMLKVAIVGNISFDALQVDPATVEFGPNKASPVRVSENDYNRDGYSDLILTFSLITTGISCGDTEATLTGETYGGEAIEGSDYFTVEPCP